MSGTGFDRSRTAAAALLVVCAGMVAAPWQFAQARQAGATAEATPAQPVTEPAPLPEGAIRVQPSSTDVIEALTAQFRERITLLADPKMEGRAPGTQGNRDAADYLEARYRELGLRPAFAQDVAGEDAPRDAEGMSYRQRFIAPPSLRPGDSVELVTQSLAMAPTANAPATQAGAFVAGTDFNVLGYSGSGKVTGIVAFAGYAIPSGQDGYTSFPDENPESKTKLDGQIAMVLRFEPMNAEGSSKWSETRWSPAADLRAKLDAVIDRGAAGIILVNPPGANDPRAGRLESLGFGLSARALPVPVVMMSQEAADRLVRAGDAQGRSLLELRQLADEAGVVVPLTNANVTLEAELRRKALWTDNVGAVLPGVGRLEDEVVVVGSHYDHLGYGYFGSREPNPQGKLHPGADDNASGTTANLLVAQRVVELLREVPATQPRRRVLFLQFCAEESGLNGSRHYAQNPIVPLDQHVLMINLDMIGRLRENKLEVSGVGTGEGLADFAKPYFDASGMVVATRRSGMGPSDHASFASAGVPALFFFTGLTDEYHKPSDTVDTINFAGAAKISDLVSRIVVDAALRPSNFPFTTPTGGPRRDAAAPGAQAPGTPAPAVTMTGMRVRLGFTPGDYQGEIEGVLIDAVAEGLPAQKAGLRKGDIIVAINGNTVRDMEGWMGQIARFNPGDVVTIAFVRDGQRQETQATLVGREPPRRD